MIIDHPRPPAAEFIPAFAEKTGWELKPQGACRGEICIPLPTGWHTDDTVNIRLLAEGMSLPIVEDPENGLAALGPESHAGRTLPSASAPDLTLPTMNGDTFRLSSKRGERVLLFAWAPY
jgi:hypothetical protein